MITKETYEQWEKRHQLIESCKESDNFEGNGYHYFFSVEGVPFGISYWTKCKELLFYDSNGKVVKNTGYKNVIEARQHARRILGVN